MLRSEAMHVLLVDDHPLMLDALAAAVQNLEQGISVTRVAAGCAARSLMAQRRGQFDLVLLDLHLSDINGITLLQEFRTAYPELPVVIVSGSESEEDIALAFNAGAMGFVPKRAGHQVLLEALRQVLAGEIYIPEEREFKPSDWGSRSFEQANADALRILQESPSS